MSDIMKKMTDQVTWKDITPGGVIIASGNSRNFHTGDWRIMRPVWDEAKCKQCLLCTPVCPDSSIPVDDSKRGEFDYLHCKGCGICYKVCPFDAIAMVKDKE